MFVFYGLAVRAAALGGPRHATYALLAAAELPALLANTLLLDRAGRRPLLTAAFLLTAVSLVAIPCLPGQYRPRRPQPARSAASPRGLACRDVDSIDSVMGDLKTESLGLEKCCTKIYNTNVTGGNESNHEIVHEYVDKDRQCYGTNWRRAP